MKWKIPNFGGYQKNLKKIDMQSFKHIQWRGLHSNIPIILNKMSRPTGDLLQSYVWSLRLKKTSAKPKHFFLLLYVLISKSVFTSYLLKGNISLHFLYSWNVMSVN